MHYTEATPAGPQDYGLVAEDQMGTAYGRSFAGDIPADHDGPLPFIEVVFVLVQTGQERGRTVTLERHLRHRLGDLGSTYYDETLVEVVDTADGRRDLTSQDALDACAEFDPATLDWDGFPGSEQPCEPVLSPAHGGACWVALCRTHGGSPHAPVSPDRAGAAKWWACPKGHDWTFLVDYTEPDMAPSLTDLTGLNRAAVAAVETNHYGIDQGTPIVYLYRSPGSLTPLTIRPVPGTQPESILVEGDEHNPLMTYREWEVVDLGPEGNDTTGPLYTRVTVMLNADA